MSFLVIGAQKAATSWLYLCLKEHPRLHLPPHKREVEYLGGELHRTRGDAWYTDLVFGGAPPDALAGDVSVEYLYDAAAPPEAARVLPQARLIVSLRDPVERAVSAYFWNLRKGRLPADMPLQDALARGIRWLEDVGDEDVPPPGPAEELAARGRYDVQLRRWLAHYAPERFLVLDYAEIQARPERALGRVWSFLAVPSFRPEALESRPKRNTYAAPLARLERLAPRFRPWAALLDRVQRVWPGPARRPLQTLPADLRAAAYRAYGPSFDATRDLLRRIPTGLRPAHPSFTAPEDGG
ncbi:MAG: sulfotransferase domain-containing protein [Gemmatimonadota bacterium]